MSCRDARELLSSLLDGALAPEEEAAVREHLESCEACREELSALEEVVGLVHSVPRPEAPPGFAEGVLERLPRRGRRRLLLWLAPLAAAACLVLVVRFATPPPSSGPEAVRDVARHARDGKPESVPDAESRLFGEEESLEAREPSPVEPWKIRSAAKEGAPRKPPSADRTLESKDKSELAKGSRLGRPPSDPAAAPEPTALEPAAEAPPTGGTPAEVSIPSGPPAEVSTPGGTPVPATPAPPGEPVREGILEEGRASGRRYLLSGAEPDAAAGWVLAELRNRRGRAGHEELDETLVNDESGEPTLLVVNLAQDELDFLEGLAEERGVRFSRTNGEKAGATFGKQRRGAETDAEATEEGGSAESGADDACDEDERLRAVIRFRR